MSIKLSTRNIVGLGGSALAVVGAFLPMVTIKAMGVSQTEKYFASGHGKIFLALVVVSALLMVINKYKWSLVTSGAGLALLVWDWLKLQDAISTAQKAAGELFAASVSISLALGAYIMVVGVVVALGAIFIKEQASTSSTS